MPHDDPSHDDPFHDGAQPQGLAHGLTHYGDPGFAAYLRRSFARSMGYSHAMLLKRPIDGHRQLGQRAQQLPSPLSPSSSRR